MAGPRDWWDKLDILGKVLLPVVIAGIGSLYSYHQNQRAESERITERVAGYVRTLNTGTPQEQTVALRLLLWEARRHPGDVPAQFLQPLVPSLVTLAAGTRDSTLATAATAVITQAVQNIDQAALQLPRSRSRVFFEIRTEEQGSVAAALARDLGTMGFTVPRVERVDQGPGTTQIRYYRQRDSTLADTLAAVLHSHGVNVGAPKHYPGYENSPLVRDGTLEVWFGPR